MRGHDETDSSDNPGMFQGLVDFVSFLDTVLKEHLEIATVFKVLSNSGGPVTAGGRIL